MTSPKITIKPIPAVLGKMNGASFKWVGLPLALAASCATAQPAPPTSNAALEEVLVTATRRSQSVVEVPYNIQAITGAHLDNIGANELSDFVRTVPGLSFIDRGPSLGMDLVLRGLRTSTFSRALQRTTSVYIDDVEVPSNFDPYLLDVSRIEVLRGPQGTLYGSGAIGGAIRYINHKPSFDEISGRVVASIGTTQKGGTNYGTRGLINLPLIDDQLAFRGALAYVDNSGFTDNVRLGERDIDSSQTRSGSFSLQAIPTDRLSVTLSYLFQHNEFDSDTFVYENTGKYANDRYFIGGTDRDDSIANLNISYDFSLATLTSSTSNRRRDSQASRDITTLIRDEIFASFLPPEELPELTYLTVQDTNEDYWSQEFRLVSSGDSRLSWIGGLYGEKLDSREAAQEEVPIPFPGQERFEELIGAQITDTFAYYYAGKTDFEQYAVFGEVGYDLTSRLNVAFGARHFKYSADVDFFVIDQYFSGRNPDGTARNVPEPFELLVAKAEFEDTIFRFNGSYQLSDDSLTYVTVAEGFRPGGWNLVGANTGILPDQFEYDPDSIVNYEIGYKAHFRDQGIFVSGALFHIDWEDIQTSVPTATGFNVQGNAGTAHSRGVELELQLKDVLLDGMDVFGTYSYTSTELDETVPGLGFNGESLPYVPKNSGSVGFNYGFMFGNNLDAGITLLATYTGSSATDFGATRPSSDGAGTSNPYYLELDDYWLVNFSARVGSGPWTVRLQANNLLNEYADVSRFYNASTSQFQDPYVSRSVNRPRTISFSAQYDF